MPDGRLESRSLGSLRLFVVARTTLGNMRESHGMTHTISDCHRGTGKVKRTPGGSPADGVQRGPLNSCRTPVPAAATVPTRGPGSRPGTRLCRIQNPLLFFTGVGKMTPPRRLGSGWAYSN
jgi:hypothetical protein